MISLHLQFLYKIFNSKGTSNRAGPNLKTLSVQVSMKSNFFQVRTWVFTNKEPSIGCATAQLAHQLPPALDQNSTTYAHP